MEDTPIPTTTSRVPYKSAHTPGDPNDVPPTPGAVANWNSQLSDRKQDGKVWEHDDAVAYNINTGTEYKYINETHNGLKYRVQTFNTTVNAYNLGDKRNIIMREGYMPNPHQHINCPGAKHPRSSNSPVVAYNVLSGAKYWWVAETKRSTHYRTSVVGQGNFNPVLKKHVIMLDGFVPNPKVLTGTPRQPMSSASTTTTIGTASLTYVSPEQIKKQVDMILKGNFYVGQLDNYQEILDDIVNIVANYREEQR